MTASPDELKRLTQALIAAGRKTADGRKACVETILGREIASSSDLSSADVDACLQQLEADRQCLAKVTEIAKRVFRLDR